MNYYIRPECGRDDRVGPTLGPFSDYVQLTYAILTIGPDGDPLASLGQKDSNWYFEGDTKQLPINHKTEHGLNGAQWFKLAWSDLIIWAEPATTT